MRPVRLLLWTSIVAGLLVAIVHPSAAHAAGRVLVMNANGRVHARIDPALPAAAAWPPAGPAALATAAQRRRHAPERTVRSELKRLLATHQIDAATAAADRSAFDDAIRTARRLRGTRRAELQAAIDTLHDIAAGGQLTAARLPELFTTLARNRQWWTTGALLSYGQRVEFSDSELVWEYYPGQGIQLQVLGTFGKANGLWQARDDDKLRALLDEMLPLAAQRGGALAWEYDFAFGGGSPPWTSAMSQATGIQALARASQELHEPAYLTAAGNALKLFSLRPPVGVRVPTKAGARYLLYSFAPGEIVINAFVQTLVGLYDYAQIADSGLARRLFAAGDRQARLDVPAGDTGAWSLYQLGGAESDLSYHELLTGFLQNLCQRTQVAVYCTTGAAYARDLKDAPTLTLLTRRVRAGRYAQVRFSLSKVSRVGMTIRRERDGKTVLATSASVSHGTHAYGWRVPSRPGRYDVTLTGTDLAGNGGRATGTIAVIGRAPRT
ncbi:MAG TPA: D-glucuronyl C5-epimerase family protein [Conexibacter sp.]|nr:D-glucuronyl C5-epimerase family protein [Conexibacter sp.]